MIKNPPAVQEAQETQVQSLDGEDRLEKGMAIHSGILAWRIPMDRGAWRAEVTGSQRIRHDRATMPSIAWHLLLAKSQAKTHQQGNIDKS